MKGYIELLNSASSILEFIQGNDDFKENRDFMNNLTEAIENIESCIDIINEKNNSHKKSLRKILIQNYDFDMFNGEELYAIGNKTNIATEVIEDDKRTLKLMRHPAFFTTEKDAKRYIRESGSLEELKKGNYVIIPVHNLNDYGSFILCEYIL